MHFRSQRFLPVCTHKGQGRFHIIHDFVCSYIQRNVFIFLFIAIFLSQMSSFKAVIAFSFKNNRNRLLAPVAKLRRQHFAKFPPSLCYLAVFLCKGNTFASVYFKNIYLKIIIFEQKNLFTHDEMKPYLSCESFVGDRERETTRRRKIKSVFGIINLGQKQH